MYCNFWDCLLCMLLTRSCAHNFSQLIVSSSLNQVQFPYVRRPIVMMGLRHQTILAYLSLRIPSKQNVFQNLQNRHTYFVDVLYSTQYTMPLNFQNNILRRITLGIKSLLFNFCRFWNHFCA